MTDAVEPDADAACLAHVLDPAADRAPAGVSVTQILAGAVRALARRGAPAEDHGDGIRLMEVSRYRAEPGDVVVVYVPGHLLDADRVRIREGLAAAFPSNRCLILEGGVGLDVVAPADVPAVPAS